VSGENVPGSGTSDCRWPEQPPDGKPGQRAPSARESARKQSRKAVRDRWVDLLLCAVMADAAILVLARSVRPRKLRSASESAQRHAMPRSESMPSKKPIKSMRTYALTAYLRVVTSSEIRVTSAAATSM
jgi:hypothetical protein